MLGFVFRRLRRKLAGTRRMSRGTAPAYPEQFLPSMDLAPFSGIPRLYLIASTPRCGSHFLGHALTGAGSYGVPLEYLNMGNMPSWTARFGTDDIPTLLGHMVALRTSPNGTFGLKAHWSQFRPYADLALFRPFGGIERIVFIYRRDLLGQAISYLRARQTGQYISGAASRGVARYRYTGILDCAREIRMHNGKWAAYFRNRYQGPGLTTVYEDLIADQAAGFADIAAFLGGPVPRASGRTQRQSDDISTEWRQAFLNELRRADRWVTEPQSW